MGRDERNRAETESGKRKNGEAFHRELLVGSDAFGSLESLESGGAELSGKDFGAVAVSGSSSRLQSIESIRSPSGFFLSSTADRGGLTTTDRMAVHREVPETSPRS
jgi:hypothetical protein